MNLETYKKNIEEGLAIDNAYGTLPSTASYDYATAEYDASAYETTPAATEEYYDETAQAAPVDYDQQVRLAVRVN